MNFDYVDLVFGLLTRKAIIQKIEGELSQPGPVHEFEQGRVSARRLSSGALLVLFDTGGGHRGARGLVYSSDPSLTSEVHRQELSLGESITLKRLTKRWSSYRSTEE